jgi:hypothetical protein
LAAAAAASAATAVAPGAAAEAGDRPTAIATATIRTAGRWRYRARRRAVATVSRGVIPDVVAAALGPDLHISITVLHRAVTTIDAIGYPFSATTYSM